MAKEQIASLAGRRTLQSPKRLDRKYLNYSRPPMQSPRTLRLTQHFCSIPFGSARNSQKISATVAPDSTVSEPLNFKSMPVSAQNQFLALRMSSRAPSTNFSSLHLRTPAGVAYTFGPDEEDNGVRDKLQSKDGKPPESQLEPIPRSSSPKRFRFPCSSRRRKKNRFRSVFSVA